MEVWAVVVQANTGTEIKRRLLPPPRWIAATSGYQMVLPQRISSDGAALPKASDALAGPRLQHRSTSYLPASPATPRRKARGPGGLELRA
ncbi:hypothetical protein KM043_001184 [Ampulex compressa]|nr:hypothetical protein KM043_001184 [Ampulex compressa]